MDSPLVSIIVPVYQAKDYVSSCVQGVLRQTYSHWELILVDDGSTDGSGAVCDEYAAKDNRIRVFHQENGGVSAARNRGIAYARGEYITFADADDHIKPDFLEVLCRDALEQGADIVCCNVEESVNGQCHDFFCVRGERKYQNVETYFRDYYERKEQYGYFVWAKLIKAELVKRHSFQPLCYSEDTLFVAELFLEEPMVYLDDYVGYTYIRRETSVTKKHGNHYIPHRLDQLNSSVQIFEASEKQGKEICISASEQFAFQLHTAAATTVFCGKQEFLQHRKTLLAYADRLKPHWEKLSRKARQRLWLYIHAPAVYYLRIRAIPLLKGSKV